MHAALSCEVLWSEVCIFVQVAVPIPHCFIAVYYLLMPVFLSKFLIYYPALQRASTTHLFSVFFVALVWIKRGGYCGCEEFAIC